VRQVWRNEALVRASMVASGEADWADNIGFENADQVPQPIQSGTNEIYTLVPDTIWHPELSKKEVRMALAHAVDCQEIVDTLYEGRMSCHANISQPGTLGITPENSAPYEYDPEMSRRLLEEADFDFDTEINIFTRDGRVYRDLELYEAVVGYWSDIGVQGRVEVLENAQATNHRRSGCGQYGEDALNCASMPPAPPVNASTDYVETATSNETLDYQRQNLLRLSCFNVNSRVCDPELEEKISVANSTPLGDLRRQRMEEIATIAHDEYYFLPFFHIQAVYGLAEDLEWASRYDPRIRVSTMRFR
jgi:ABC-type transport system substrate-binding protein